MLSRYYLRCLLEVPEDSERFIYKAPYNDLGIHLARNWTGDALFRIPLLAFFETIATDLGHILCGLKSPLNGFDSVIHLSKEDHKVDPNMIDIFFRTEMTSAGKLF